MRRWVGALLLAAAGFLMGFGAVVYATISVPHLRGDLVEIHVRPTLLAAVSLGLYFGAFAMFGFALLVLAGAARAWLGAPPSRTGLAIIAAVHVAFGVGAFFAWNGSVHALAYVLMGALVALAAAAISPAPPAGRRVSEVRRAS